MPVWNQYLWISLIAWVFSIAISFRRKDIVIRGISALIGLALVIQLMNFIPIVSLGVFILNIYMLYGALFSKG